jgi:uncharacterized protein (TIGR02118 family)
MRKLFFLCRRRPDLTHARYVELLLGGHVPLALAHHPTLRAYVVNVVEASPPEGPELDSIGELSFDTLNDYRTRLYDSPAGEARIREDVARFLGGADAYVTTEHVQKDTTRPAAPGARSPGVKLVCPLVRRADLTHDQFVAHWLERHVPLARRHHPGLTRYVTNVVDEPLSPGAPPLDGIAELSFATPEDAGAERMFDSGEGERLVREDIARFIGRVAPYRVAEWVQRRAPTRG